MQGRDVSNDYDWNADTYSDLSKARKGKVCFCSTDCPERLWRIEYRAQRNSGQAHTISFGKRTMVRVYSKRLAGPITSHRAFVDIYHSERKKTYQQPTAGGGGEGMPWTRSGSSFDTFFLLMVHVGCQSQHY